MIHVMRDARNRQQPTANKHSESAHLMTGPAITSTAATQSRIEMSYSTGIKDVDQTNVHSFHNSYIIRSDASKSSSD
jgi:hypothetical protein